MTSKPGLTAAKILAGRCPRGKRVRQRSFAGRIHLGKGIIERDIEERVPQLNAPLILYCGGGYRSALAADNLQKMGYTNVLSMDGGIRGWREKQFSSGQIS